MPTDYVRAESISEAVDLLANGDDGTRVLAGGQSLVPMMNLGLANPTMVVDISGIEELQTISLADDTLRLGAGVTHSSLVSSAEVQDAAPLLAEAARQIGSKRIRNFGTIGGSLAHADPAAELPLVCHVLGATVELVGPDGQRSLPISEFTLGYYTTALVPGEIVQSVSIPRTEGKGWGFHEYARRAGDFAIVAVGALIEMSGGKVVSASLGVANVSDKPIRLASLEEQLEGSSREEAIELATRVSELVDPSDDDYVPRGYRKRLAGVLAKRAIADATGGTHKDKR